mmetsp:Transcript_39831/g.68311  ORF Transcript_39831/g.68311 Transcript_39831/m.68311 type:complete len:233 (+) Transcript_39831:1807-2505(+)
MRDVREQHLALGRQSICAPEPREKVAPAVVGHLHVGRVRVLLHKDGLHLGNVRALRQLAKQLDLLDEGLPVPLRLLLVENVPLQHARLEPLFVERLPNLVPRALCRAQPRIELKEIKLELRPEHRADVVLAVDALHADREEGLACEQLGQMPAGEPRQLHTLTMQELLRLLHRTSRLTLRRLGTRCGLGRACTATRRLLFAQRGDVKLVSRTCPLVVLAANVPQQTLEVAML